MLTHTHGYDLLEQKDTKPNPQQVQAQGAGSGENQAQASRVLSQQSHPAHI